MSETLEDQFASLIKARDNLGDKPTLSQLNNLVKDLTIQYDIPTAANLIQIYYTNSLSNGDSTSALAHDISRETGFNSNKQLNVVAMGDTKLASYMEDPKTVAMYEQALKSAIGKELTNVELGEFWRKGITIDGQYYESSCELVMN